LEAVRLKNDSPFSWLGIFLINMKRHAYKEAASAAQEIVKLEPGEGKSWMYLGTAYLLAGKQAEEAVKAFQECVRLAPSDARCWTFLGRAQRAAGQLDASLESLQRALRLSPDEASAWYQLGLTYLKQGDDEKAYEVWMTLWGLNSDLADELAKKLPLPK
jgi:superkiller protein 3